MQTVRTFETANNTYYLGYGITAKTSYEQRKEQRERFLVITAQRIVAIVLITICLLVSVYTGEGMILVVGLLVGSLMLFCKNLFYQEA